MTATDDTPTTTTKEAHCLHVVGIGRTGAVYVEALLRTGEIEDMLADPDARFAALVVDLGDEDMGIAADYGHAFRSRLTTRGIPTERFQFQAIALPAPSDALLDGLAQSLSVLKEVPSIVASGHSGTGGARPSAPVDGHASRAVAKAVLADALYGAERPLGIAISRFAEHVAGSKHPAAVMVCFGLAGGVGGGMAVDVARLISNVKLARAMPVIGVAQLPHSGDPASLQASAAMYATLEDLDLMLDEEKNAKIVDLLGESYRAPFTGGFFVVNPEQSWQRLTAYTTTGEPAIRQRFKQTVTNRFTADSFMRLAVTDGGRDLIRALVPSGITGDAAAVRDPGRNWTMFDVAKLTHPGVQVLPGEPASKWGSVIRQWINFTPDHAGLIDGFKTDHAEVFIYGSRNMVLQAMEVGYREMMLRTWMRNRSSTLKIYTREFFDALTAYANVVLPGVAKTDLSVFEASRAAYEAAGGDARLAEHAWVIDPEATLPAGAGALEAMRGKAVWGASVWGVVPALEPVRKAS